MSSGLSPDTAEADGEDCAASFGWRFSMATAASTTPDFVRTPDSVGSTLDVQPYIDSIKSGSTLPDVTADPSLVIAQLARKVVHLEQHVSALQAKVASLTSSAAASTQLHEEASRLRHTLDAHRAALTQERTAPPPRHMESTFTMQALREWEQDHPTPHPTPGQGCALPPWVHDLQAAAATQRSRIAELELRVALAEASSPTALAVAPGPGSATRDVIPYAWRVAAAASAGVKNAGDTVPPVPAASSALLSGRTGWGSAAVTPTPRLQRAEAAAQQARDVAYRAAMSASHHSLPSQAPYQAVLRRQSDWARGGDTHHFMHRSSAWQSKADELWEPHAGSPSRTRHAGGVPQFAGRGVLTQPEAGSASCPPDT